MRPPFAMTSLCLLVGCGFQVNAGGGDGGVDGRGDAPDAQIDAPANCYGAGIGSVCLTTPPTQPLVLADNTNFNTGTAVCTEIVVKNNIELCVLAGTTVTMPSGTLRATGNRPLVVVATSTMTITGTIDASSRRGGYTGAGAGPTVCGAPAVGALDTGGGGGGAGGSFGGRGGMGGEGDENDTGSPAGQSAGGISHMAAVPTTIRGGCAGGSGGTSTVPPGAGGNGGGAVYLIAGTSITVTGTVRASGAGGGAGNQASGGGGGGSGGFLGFDAPTTMISGNATANGGGGGEGGGTGQGDPGDDGGNDVFLASGGSGTFDAGNGGNGSGGATLGGEDGDPENGGGGGGGGGAGYIYVKGALANPGIVSPPAAVTP